MIQTIPSGTTNCYLLTPESGGEKDPGGRRDGGGCQSRNIEKTSL